MRSLRRPELTRAYDLAIAGSGFAGALMAMIARRQGRSVLLLERGKHPRITIGESSTPLANLLLEELAIRYDLPALKPLSKWGSWQHTYPKIACGLKRGFTFYHHDLEAPGHPELDRSRQLLVAASPHDDIADTHWYRADFDELLVRQAQAMGVDYLDEASIASFIESDTGVSFSVTRSGLTSTYRASFFIDATGPRGLLHRALRRPEASLPGYPQTCALYSHFTGVVRPASTLESPPYPPDDAAVHHLFDGGWIWVLRFNNGVTSAGVAATPEAAHRLNLQEGEPAWQRLIASIPALQSQFAIAKPIQSFTYLPQVSFLSSQICGRRWVMLPSAAGVIDPLLSTGFPLTLLGIGRLAEILALDWESAAFATALQRYARQTSDELYATSRIIAALYANMRNFAVFEALSLLYFAAASYSETARRLGKSHLAQSFLLHDHPVFGLAAASLIERASKSISDHETFAFIADVHRAIEPFDVAGLTNPDRRRWYPVDAEDLLRAAYKVDSSREEIQSLLQTCGFYRT